MLLLKRTQIFMIHLKVSGRVSSFLPALFLQSPGPEFNIKHLLVDRCASALLVCFEESGFPCAEESRVLPLSAQVLVGIFKHLCGQMFPCGVEWRGGGEEELSHKMHMPHFIISNISPAIICRLCVDMFLVDVTRGLLLKTLN